MASPLSLSPNATVSLSRFGNEQQPLLAVEDALPDPHMVVDIASRHSYQPIGPFYPGVRAVVAEHIAMDLVAPLIDTLTEVFDLPSAPAYHECYLSIVTTPPGSLAPIQRLPHFDGLEPERIAVLLYLDKVERGGTAFYRQRATGYETVDATRFDRYRTTLDAGVRESGMPEPAYIAGDTELFDMIYRVDGRFNRMVAYRGNSLHCASLPSDFSPVPDPARGRLTLNLFLTASQRQSSSGN